MPFPKKNKKQDTGMSDMSGKSSSYSPLKGLSSKVIPPTPMKKGIKKGKSFAAAMKKC
jgi:hypothetical protein